MSIFDGKYYSLLEMRKEIKERFESIDKWKDLDHHHRELVKEKVIETVYDVNDVFFKLKMTDKLFSGDINGIEFLKLLKDKEE